MITPQCTGIILDFILALKDGDEDRLVSILKSINPTKNSEIFSALLRQAIFYNGVEAKYWRRIRNVWDRSGRTALKKISTNITIELLGDGTIDALAPHLALFLAAYGIGADIKIGVYDSVEHEALAGGEKSGIDVTIVLLSEYWLRRHLPTCPVVPEQFEDVARQIEHIVHGLCRKHEGVVLLTNFYQGGWPRVASAARIEEGRLSWNSVLERLNQKLIDLSGDRVIIADAQTAIHLAGGVNAVGQLAQTRMRAPFEEVGFIAVAREIASVLANTFGRSHRALLTDWDNTLWGGEIADAGFHGIQCGQDGADGYGYYLLQTYIRDLASLGVLIAAVSRNDPKMAALFDENPHFALKRKDFSSLALSYEDKSLSVQQVAQELNFGTDLMVFLDDNHVDLAEVLIAFPEIDIILAGPEPDQSLTRLSRGRYFNAARLTDQDITRAQQATALHAQRTAMKSAASKEEFLASLEIKVTASALDEQNRERVLQLLQKTNQFNLTTRRYQLGELNAIIERGGKIGVFNYVDRFGPQGIIGVIILAPQPDDAADDDGYEIDVWLMSCRVLNRGVEEIMLQWAQEESAELPLWGQYLPTEKNELVRDLYPKLGFKEDPSATGRYVKKDHIETIIRKAI